MTSSEVLAPYTEVPEQTRAQLPALYRRGLSDLKPAGWRCRTGEYTVQIAPCKVRVKLSLLRGGHTH